jgi:3-methyladenine DNA glycosylase AlkD
MRNACKQVFARHPLASFDEWRDVVLLLFRSATRREQRYAAIELAGAARYREFRGLRALPIFEEMIVTGAWWDLVDGIATHLLGGLMRRNPKRMKPIMLRWARGKDMWKRRSAILCQIGAKEQTDLEHLYACIQPSLGSEQFFLRKAIGWALRQYAWTDPDAVVAYVRAHEHELSPLSRREALKNVTRPRRRGARTSTEGEVTFKPARARSTPRARDAASRVRTPRSR